MKIAITATAPDLDARVDPRFGRCPYFLIVETDDLSFEAVENPNVTQGSGAGIQSARLMVDKGVQHVLTGTCGPNAHQTLAAANIAVSAGCSDSVREAVDRFQAGELPASLEPNVSGHYGTSAAFQSDQPSQGPAVLPQDTARDMGGGMGGGRGMGRGRGRGMGRGAGQAGGGGRGRGRGRGAPSGSVGDQVSPATSGQDELTTLKQEAEAMSRQMQKIQQRIQQFEQEKE